MCKRAAYRQGLGFHGPRAAQPAFHPARVWQRPAEGRGAGFTPERTSTRGPPYRGEAALAGQRGTANRVNLTDRPSPRSADPIGSALRLAHFGSDRSQPASRHGSGTPALGGRTAMKPAAVIALAAIVGLTGLGPAVAADDSRVKGATHQVEDGAKSQPGRVGPGVEQTAKGIGRTVVEGPSTPARSSRSPAAPPSPRRGPRGTIPATARSPSAGASGTSSRASSRSSRTD
jgi:hypothetical protein